MPDDIRQFVYEPTPARVEILAGYDSLVELLKRRADEHTRRGFRERAHKLLGHAQTLYARSELIQMDWEQFDKEDRAAGLEPY